MPLSRNESERRARDEEERERVTRIFDRLGVVLCIPLPSPEGLAGLIALGQKRSGELFVDEDLELLTTIANQAATAIRNAKSYEALEALNRDLEQKVAKRTAALREALAQKERTQEQLIRSESLAAIGQLVAGTAHELNNPIAGAMSLVENSVETIEGWNDLPENGKRSSTTCGFPSVNSAERGRSSGACSTSRARRRPMWSRWT